MAMQQVVVGNLRPNPFRQLDDYPIDREKVDALKESITTTGFWGTIVARKSGSKFEIAFGHHRMKAMEEMVADGTMKKSEKIDIIVRDLSNEDMIQMMARENLEEWGTNAYIEAQTVESTIRAFGAGDIELPEVPKDTPGKHLRRATSERSYTIQQVASFLGWLGTNNAPNHCCRVAFEMLDAFDAKVITREQLRGVRRDVAREIITKSMALKREQERIAKDRAAESKRAEEFAANTDDAKEKRAFKSLAKKKRNQSEIAESSSTEVAKEFASDAVKQVKSGNWAQRDVREAGAEAKSSLRSTAERRFKDAKQYYEALSRRIARMCNESGDDEFKSLVSLLDMDCGLEPHQIEVMLVEVEALQKRTEKFAKKLRNWNQPKRTDAVGDSQLRIVG